MLVVGLDLATRRVAAACPEAGFTFSTGTWGTRAQPKRDYPGEADIGYAMGRQLLHAMNNHRWPESYLMDNDFRFVYERPMAFKGIKTALGQCLSAGALLSQIHPLGPAVECSNTQWKKELIGHGHTDAAGYRAWLEAHHPALAAVCGEDPDLFAAHCIALWAAGVEP